MRWVVVAAIALVALGCKSKAKAPPVAAAPVAEPVSVPQTGVRLPPAQPIPPGAIPPEPEPRPVPAAAPTVVTPPPVPTAPARRAPVAKAPRRPEPSPPTPPPAAPVSVAPPLRPVLTAEQEQDLRQRIARSLSAAEQSLARAGDKDREGVERVRAFIEQTQQASRQGDLIRARSLAERAEWLASDLAQSPK